MHGGRRFLPPLTVVGAVVGRQRFGVRLLNLIVTLREVGRLPYRTIRRWIATVHGVSVSLGAIVVAQHRSPGPGQRS